MARRRKLRPGQCICVRNPRTGRRVKICYTSKGARIVGTC